MEQLQSPWGQSWQFTRLTATGCLNPTEDDTMPRLKLGAIEDDKPIKLTHEMPASVHRDLVAYAQILAQETGQPVQDPARLIAPMLVRFMAADRSFRKARRARQRGSGGEGSRSESKFRKAASAGFSLSARQYAEKSNRLGPEPSRSSG